MEPRFLTVAEAARYVRLNPRSVYLLAQRGGIPASRVTGKWLFTVETSDEWIDASARGRSHAPTAPGAALPSGNLVLAGGDDPALALLPDAVRAQAGHPLLFIATLGSLGGLAARAGWATWSSAPTLTPIRGPISRVLSAFRPSRRRVNVFSRELARGGRTSGRRGGDSTARSRFELAGGSGTRAFTEYLAAAGSSRRGSGIGRVSTHWAVAPGSSAARLTPGRPGRGCRPEPRVRALTHSDSTS